MTNTTWLTGPPSAASTSAFRAWGGGISDALDAIGMLPVDTNIDWATIGVSGTNTESGYETWRLPGALHGTAPLFIRFGYGSHGSSVVPKLTVRVGTSNAGGGVLGGTLTSTITINGNSASTNIGTLGSWAACDGEGFVMALFPSSGTTGARAVLAVDRHRSPVDGEARTTGFGVYVVSSTANAIYQVDLVHPEVFAALTGNAPCVTYGGIPTDTSQVNALGQAQVWPWWHITRNGKGITKMLCTVAELDLIGGADQVVGWLPTSTDRTIRGIGDYSDANCDIEGSAGARLAIWWSD